MGMPSERKWKLSRSYCERCDAPMGDFDAQASFLCNECKGAKFSVDDYIRTVNSRGAEQRGRTILSIIASAGVPDYDDHDEVYNR